MRSPPSYQESLKKVNQLLSASADLSDADKSSVDPVNDDFVERILHFDNKRASSSEAVNNRHFTVVNNVINVPQNIKQALIQQANEANDTKHLPFYLNSAYDDKNLVRQQSPMKNGTRNDTKNNLSLADVVGHSTQRSTRRTSQSPLKQPSAFFTSEIEKELSNLTLSIEREMEKQQQDQQRHQQEYYGACTKCGRPVVGRNEACQAMKK